jgi:signal transduction histidine kinase
MMNLMIGIALGILLTVPLVMLAARRTERRVRLLERRTRTAERLAEIGTMTSGLAHEIKNPLSTIGLNAQLIQEDMRDMAQALPDDEASGDHMRRIQRRFDGLTRETQRLRDILEDFLRFAGRMKLDLAPTNINDLVTELSDFFAAQAQASGLQLRTQLTPGALTAPADGSLIKQALLNLLINASQAMVEARQQNKPHGGASELLIRTEKVRVLNQDEVRIHVIDTGPGIADDHREKIFRPYFSTKRGGTGLGLPTARRIIEEHHGSLTVHGEPGRGTDFIISLPVTPPVDG